jgi:hypothetical protein
MGLYPLRILERTDGTGILPERRESMTDLMHERLHELKVPTHLSVLGFKTGTIEIPTTSKLVVAGERENNRWINFLSEGIVPD